MSQCLCYGCEYTGPRTYTLEAKPYCETHYFLALQKQFFAEYNSWDGTGHPEYTFLYSFSRYYTEYRNECLPGALSLARIRDRSINFHKNDSGFTFEIERHPGAWRDGYGHVRLQKFSYDINKNELILISENNTMKFFVG